MLGQASAGDEKGTPRSRSNPHMARLLVIGLVVAIVLAGTLSSRDRAVGSAGVPSLQERAQTPEKSCDSRMREYLDSMPNVARDISEKRDMIAPNAVVHEEGREVPADQISPVLADSLGQLKWKGASQTGKNVWSLEDGSFLMVNDKCQVWYIGVAREEENGIGNEAAQPETCMEKLNVVVREVEKKRSRLPLLVSRSESLGLLNPQTAVGFVNADGRYVVKSMTPLELKTELARVTGGSVTPHLLFGKPRVAASRDGKVRFFVFDGNDVVKAQVDDGLGRCKILGMYFQDSGDMAGVAGHDDKPCATKMDKLFEHFSKATGGLSSIVAASKSLGLFGSETDFGIVRSDGTSSLKRLNAEQLAAAIDEHAKLRGGEVFSGHHKRMVNEEDGAHYFVFANNDAVKATVDNEDMSKCRVVGAYLSNEATKEIHPDVARIAASSDKVLCNGAFAEMGCKEDSGDRILKGKKVALADNSIITCWAQCQDFQYFGMELGDCFCGNKLYRDVMKRGECTTPCAGAASEKCGGWWRMSLYRNKPAATNLGTGHRYLGCMEDAANRRLPSRRLHDPAMTIEKCAENCAGYEFFGLQWYSECFCAEKPTSYAVFVNRCNTRCSGNSAQMCGGSWANSVYQQNWADKVYTVANPATPSNVIKFAPVLYFNKHYQKSYPMDAQTYYNAFCNQHAASVTMTCSGLTYTMHNLHYQGSFDKSKMKTYYRVGTCRGHTTIDYWWYYGNQWPCYEGGFSCTKTTLDNFNPGAFAGGHPEDWEHVMVMVSPDGGRVDKVRYYQHSGFVELDRYNFERHFEHPKIYVGHRSHGSYPRSATKAMNWNAALCQYFGDAEIDMNFAHEWKTWESTLYSLRPYGARGRTVAQAFMMPMKNFMCRKTLMNGHSWHGYFKGIYGTMNNDQNICTGTDSKNCNTEDGCGMNTCPIQGPGGCPSGSYCCISKLWRHPLRCERRQNDWAGVPYCPKECRGCWNCGHGTC